MTADVSAPPASDRLVPGSGRWSVAVAAGLIVLAAAVAYHNSFGGPFVFDDWPTIKENASLRPGASWGEVLLPPAATTASGRPLFNVTLALNHAWSGEAVWSYHVVNLLIHALASLTLFGLVRRTLEQPCLRARWAPAALPLAFSAALLWTLHPLQTESVTYIVQRAEALMGLFLLLTLYGFARAVAEPGKKRWPALAVAACFAGMASKEVMVAAPVLALLYDRAFVTGSWREAWRQHRRLLLGLAAGWLLLALNLAATGGNRDGSVGFGTGVTFPSYWLTQPRAIATYLKLAVWPHPLVFEYGTEWITRDGQVVPFALLVLPLAALALVAIWRWPRPGFLGAWFFALLAPTSLMPGINQMIVEHRMYLSLAALVVFVVLGAYSLLGRRSVLVGLGVAIACGVLTARRIADYRDEITLWSDTVAKRPHNALAHRVLADFLWQDERGVRLDRIPAALAHYQRSLELAPDSPVTHENYGAALFLSGDIAGGLRHTREALRLSPDRHLAHYNLGLAHVQLGQLAEAIREFATAARLRPDYVNAQKNLGNALAESGQPTAALPCYAAALQRQPHDAEALYNLGNALFRLGRYAAARERYTAALRTTPDDADTHDMLGQTLARLGDNAAALKHLESAARLRASASPAPAVAPASGLPQIERARR
jgi:protein O-mannosyl-transferase